MGLFGSRTPRNAPPPPPDLPDGLRGRTERGLDLRAVPEPLRQAHLLRAAGDLGSGEYLSVRVEGLRWPVMASLQAAGHTYRLVGGDPHPSRFLVWRRYTPDQRVRYLDGSLAPGPWIPIRYVREDGGRTSSRSRAPRAPGARNAPSDRAARERPPRERPLPERAAAVV